MTKLICSGLVGARRKSSIGEDEKTDIARENGIEFEIVGRTTQPKGQLDDDFFNNLRVKREPETKSASSIIGALAK